MPSLNLPFLYNFIINNEKRLQINLSVCVSCSVSSHDQANPPHQS